MQVYDVTSFLALHPGGGQLVVDAAAQATWSCKPVDLCFSFFLCKRHFVVTFALFRLAYRILLHSLREHMEKD